MNTNYSSQSWPLDIVERLQDIPHRRWQNEQLEKIMGGSQEITSAQFQQIFTYLDQQKTLNLTTEEIPIKELDTAVTLIRPSQTPAWPMGTNIWIRDLTLIADRFLKTAGSAIFPNKVETGRQLLLAALTLMSTSSQLKRFKDMIAGHTDPTNAHDWPHIFLIGSNLSGQQPESWSHKQEAWQMTASVTLDAIGSGQLKEQDLTPNQREFLSLCAPFLEKIQYWQDPSSGSWEEIEALRTSVLAWEAHLLKQLNQGNLASRGQEVIAQHLPFEAPAYDQSDPRYRQVDATLVYLLQLDMAGNQSNAIIEQIQTISDTLTGGIRRYSGDSYQRHDFYRPDIAAQLKARFKSTSGDSSSPENFTARDQLVPQGREAAWVHPVWQLSAYYGRRYQKTHNPADRADQHQYFIRGLRLITDANALTIEPDVNIAIKMKTITSASMPECYITLGLPNQEVIVPSPHTPLNWAVAEAIDAFAVMETTLQAASNPT